MHPHAKILRKLTCTMFLVMYVLFLGFQVRYNLNVASTVKLHRQVANEKHTFSEKLVAKQNHAAVLAKSKTVPTKRFHPKSASFTPTYFLHEPIVHSEYPLRFYYSTPFTQQPALADAPLRGPPAIIVC